MSQKESFELTIKADSSMGDVKELMENVLDLGGTIIEQTPEHNSLEIRLPRGKINDLDVSHVEHLQYVDDSKGETTTW
ncbi:uncharacterized protein J8A68_000475 [[Candida] subhashii]|uniref:Uncharacterized protein n=1 Tax=[Candida] subhashii TaxID=561895 RepID=A0A8J5QWC9_9ASCO|nr:uncharacterized protein J8A68_000475 [[Candida] subhashii]KAG7666045.1 hypothetical protein J8A68_000475 [[Candida] subhashii]